MVPLAQDGALVEVAPLEVFSIGPDGDLVPVGPTPEPDSPLDLIGAGSEALNQLRGVRATRGPRLGVSRGRVERRGESEDVAQPVLVRPGAAARVVDAGHLFTEPIRGLHVDPDSRSSEGDGIVWTATVGRGRFRRGRRARLTLHPTPSANLSVIELIPHRPRRFRTKRFVEDGVPLVEAVGRRLRRLSYQW